MVFEPPFRDHRYVIPVRVFVCIFCLCLLFKRCVWFWLYFFAVMGKIVRMYIVLIHFQ